MQKNLRSKLKNAYSVIKKSLGERDVSGWISDNFYCIDKHYRQLLSNRNALRHTDLFAVIKRYCEDRDFAAAPKTLIECLNSVSRDFSYRELISVRALLSACAIIAIGNALADGKSLHLLPNAVKLLHSLSDPEYEDIVGSVWTPERLISDFEENYDGFDAVTKMQYREFISDHAHKNGTEESEAAKGLITEAKEQDCPLGRLLFRPKKKYAVIWMAASAFLFLLLCVFSAAAIGWLTFLLAVPYAIAAGSIADIFIRHIAPVYRAPRLELESIPDNAKTLVAVAALISGGKSDERIYESLARFSYMNPDSNIYFCLLADLPDSDMPYLPDDNETVNAAYKKIDELNQKHGERFCIFFRERVLNKSEGRYGGWERKRGAVSELVTHIVHGGKREFYGGDFIGEIKYLVTLDSDTNLSVGTVAEMLSVALHPVNRPVVADGKVVSGYGIIQPSVRTELKSAYKTGFSRLISGAGGADVYATAAFHRSQSLFGSGTFCGKGLIDVGLFDMLINGRLPEGLILSHDVIEGGILRTLAASDITLTDSTPANTVSFFRRQHRWLRGDFQNLFFLFGNRINGISKLRIAVTAIRHLSPVFSISALAVGAFLRGTGGFWLFLLAYSEFFLPCMATVALFLLSGSPFACLRFFSKAYSMLTQAFMRVFFEIASSCRRAFLTLNALSLAVYRLFTRKKTLEWTTSAQTEKLSSSLGKYVLDGALSAAAGLALLILARPPFVRLAGLLYFVYPLVSLVLSRAVGGGGEASPNPDEKHKKLLLAHAADMFRFYSENVGENTNHLPPDNIQLSPVYDVAMRTSPTNIGFYLVSLLAARDMGEITTEELHSRLDASLSTVERLEKYKGNLFNWYDLNDLSVIGDRYVSTVDSGNFAVMLVSLKEGLREYAAEDEGLNDLIERIEKLLADTDLASLYDKRRALFRIGVRGDGTPDSGCYDMLMSEARMTAYYAVATHAVPKKHWQSLGRTLTHRKGYIGMMSWSGTAFEYLMPQLFLPLYRDSFMYESLAFALMVQRSDSEIWGVSESGYYSFDSEMHYQYKANGLQALALRRIADDEKVVSPYSTYLSLCICGNAAVKNLEAFENRGMYGKYGLYEALDLNRDSGGICVKSYMAHHVGMSIIAVMNAVTDNIFVRRFMADMHVCCANELLQEKIPIDAHIFGDRNAYYAESKQTSAARRNSTETPKLADPSAVLLTRGDMTAIVTSSGHIGLSCGERMLSNTSFQKYSLRFTPAVIFTRAGRSYGCSPLYGGAGYGFERGSDSVSHIVSGRDFSGRVRFSMSKSCNCFIINTRAEALKKYDITFVFEPVLETAKKFLSHISFTRLFIESEYDTQKRILYFHRRSGLDGRHVFTLAVAPRDKNDAFSFLTNRESFAAGSLSDPLDYAAAIPDNGIGACIDPLCLVRTSEADGGRTTFLVTCAETKRECERNIRIARAEKADFRIPAHDRIIDSLLSALLYNTESVKVDAFSDCGIGELWSRGISGDHPMAVVSICEVAVTRTDAILRSFLALARACIRCELIFLVTDGDGYNRPVEASLRERCAKQGVSQYIGRNGGIFILRESELKPEFARALKNAARFYTDFSRGTVCTVPEEAVLPTVCTPHEAHRLPLPENAIRSGNGYFIENGYVVDKSALPKAPYSFVLTGRRFSTVVTQSSLGYTFFDNARERRLCSFYGDSRSTDNGERVFLVANGKKYDLCAVSNRVVYEKGKAVYSGEAEGIAFTVTVTVPPKYPVKLIRVRYPKGVSAETQFSVEPVMGDSIAPISGIEIMPFAASGNACIMFRNVFGMTFPEGRGFAGVCGGSADADKKTLSANLNDVIFFLGACMTETGARSIAARIDRYFFDSSLDAAIGFADSLIPKISVSTRSNANDAMMNFFLPYQVAACRFFARGSFYQSGGAYGFRDQLQDSLALIFALPHAVRTHIIRCCAHQYLEGDVMHWWHTRHQNRVNSGIRSKCSDDLLYLPFVTADYIEKTGDTGLLDVGVRYLESPPLGNAGERYEYPSRSDVKESVYHHCLRALSRAEQRGKNGLLLMGSCDWNDAFSLVGEKGIGESVFSTLLFIISAEKFIPIAESRGDIETAEHYRETIAELRGAVEEKAFFGDRYARAFCDDGTVLGIEGCEECEIDILSQAFAAMAGLDKNRTRTALTTAFSRLYDRNARIFKLFSPPFTNGSTRVGYIRGYVAGIRENGGQYTHGALWGALGMLISGMTEEGLTVLDCANPASRCADKDLARRYKIEPYAVAADIYSGLHSGRGGWSWYTGAAAWYYRIMVEQVLGLKLSANQTVISASPVIAFEADIELGSARVHIVSSRNTVSPTLDGIETAFPLLLPGGEHRLELPIRE